MAASIRFAVFPATADQETILCRTSSPSKFFIFPHRVAIKGRHLSKRRAILNAACEWQHASFVEGEEKKESRTSSISALENLKATAADRYTKERSSILAIGFSFHTVPLEIREKLSIPEAGWPHAIEELCCLNHIEEAAVLSTCNRMEIYAVALSWHRGVQEVIGWISKRSGIPTQMLWQHLFLLRDGDVVQHIFEVSAGLDSLVLGEGQILSQVKHVVRVGERVKGFGRNIDGLFKHAISVGKRVRHETNIASGAMSISSAAVELCLMKLPSTLSFKAQMLVIGAGKMGKLVIKHLAAKGCNKVVVVNRTEDRVEAIRKELKGTEIIYKPFSQILSCAAEADVVFTCTASEVPLFLKEHVEILHPAPSSKELGFSRLFVDISVPRNVGSCVYGIPSARVYNVDDLKEVVEVNKEERRRKAMEAQAIIRTESERFRAWRDSLETVPTIAKLRSHAERIVVAELEKYFSKDIARDIAKEELVKLSKAIVNKLLHGPMQHLRCNPTNDRTLHDILENMLVINRIFNLDAEVSFLEEKIRAQMEKTRK